MSIACTEQGRRPIGRCSLYTSQHGTAAFSTKKARSAAPRIFETSYQKMTKRPHVMEIPCFCMARSSIASILGQFTRIGNILHKIEAAWTVNIIGPWTQWVPNETDKLIDWAKKRGN